jgi:hypothetical protein
MEIRDAEEYRPEMESALAMHSPRPVALLIVPDISEWAIERCTNAKGNPPAMAVVDQATRGWGVLVRRAMNAAEVKSILDRIAWNGRHAAHSALCSPSVFLRHVVLHELAHLANGWEQDKEDDCDDWAFERLHHAL